MEKPEAPDSLSDRLRHSPVGKFFREIYLAFVAIRKLPPAAWLRYFYYKSHLPGWWETSIPVGPGLSIQLRKNKSDIRIFEQIFLVEDCTIDVPGFVPHTIVDGGAHIGCVTAYWLLRYPGAQIIAVEAEESNVRQLRRNVGSLPNVRIVHGAISDQHGWAVLEDPKGTAWGYRIAHIPHDQTFQKVPLITIPDLVEMTEGHSIDLLKLDIEGEEIKIFAGDMGWLSSVGAMVIEIHERIVPGCRAVFQKAVAGRPADIRQTRHNLIWIKQKPG